MAKFRGGHTQNVSSELRPATFHFRLLITGMKKLKGYTQVQISHFTYLQLHAYK